MSLVFAQVGVCRGGGEDHIVQEPLDALLATEEVDEAIVLRLHLLDELVFVEQVFEGVVALVQQVVDRTEEKEEPAQGGEEKSKGRVLPSEGDATESPDVSLSEGCEEGHGRGGEERGEGDRKDVF